jgi:hypothetical protein
MGLFDAYIKASQCSEGTKEALDAPKRMAILAAIALIQEGLSKLLRLL